eukprot:Skav225442  [mRNA]  locus=scaffold1668:178206:179264:+ [translate_table: standard]
MTWMCGPCEQNNPSTVDRCQTCRRHWSEVWLQSRKKHRSKSRRDKDKKKEKQRSEKHLDQANRKPPDAPSVPATAVTISEHLPWINSTPQARNTARRVESQEVINGGDTLPLPPNPPVQPPPLPKTSVDQAKASAEDIKLFEHLKALRSMNVELPDTMQAMYQELESKIKPDEPLQISHSHLNRLSKLRHQVATAGKKVENLDNEWNTFVKDMWNQMHSHSQMFLQCRQDLMQTYKQKQQELLSAKLAIREASMGLTESDAAHSIKEEPPDVTGQLQAFQEALVQMKSETIMVEDDDMEEMEEPEMSAEALEEASHGTEGRRTLRPRPHTTYRSSGSPTKVANGALKPKKGD